MKTFNLNQGVPLTGRPQSATNLLAALGLSAALVLIQPPAAVAATSGKAFPTPEAAVSALASAAATKNREAMRELFGLATDELVATDQVQAENELAEFNAAYAKTNRIVRLTANHCVLEIGHDLWPFPIPIVKETTQWRFDTEAGKQELLNRRIGRNELDILKVMRAYVEAQRAYAFRDRDNDEVLEFAQRIASSPGLTDGLFWPPELNGELSPLGPLFARAQSQGYRRRSTDGTDEPEPFHGYFFKLLTRQGGAAPGGKYDYIINGNMIGGFAMIAWPADYGESGIMTFIVNQQGRVYQKDLKENTARIAQELNAYDPSTGWMISPD